jgi:hypothetical protein
MWGKLKAILSGRGKKEAMSKFELFYQWLDL